ncbi:cytochrome P450 94B3 [Ricinus communis]|uniref:Cytochrome P450, putative n=1 Tax=Ricinus communis TaxID=3988 RepID=B9S0F8_RICCO|nr:cytochrome P450 94B3 [Ricinus communis]EEF42891.1 cytochrome P450, putative [Ricinus communis]|eukprot:XP_002519477.1 cytochrome P450 94B3 [Ricinus communis]
MEPLSLPLLLLLFFLCFCLYLRSSQNKPTKNGFKNYPILGALPDFLKNRHRFLDWTTEVLSCCPTNTSVFRRPGKVHGVITANPLNVEHILKTKFENYPKGERFISLLEDFLGQGIFNTDGELWRVQRKTASYEFNTKSLRNFAMENVKVELSTRLVPILARASGMNQVLDLQEMLERFAFDNICKLAFNVDPGCLGGDGTACGEFMQAFEEATTLSSARFMYALPFLWKFNKFFLLGPERTLKRSIKIVHEFADEIIQSRLAQNRDKQDQDLLSRFIGDGDNSLDFLRDIVISFILAGRDTTSSALSWFFWQLSLNPHVERKILEELEAIRARNGKNIGETYSFEELRDMHYLQAAISETLRLYPPVPVDTKACKNDDYLPDGTFVGKRWFITYHTYAMGRMESIWGKNCCEFVPERWLDDGICRQESPFKFPVFHAGPRMCLGKDMAYIQMKSIAASVVERFHIDVQNKDKCPEHLLAMTLRMKDGLHVKVKERCSSDYRAPRI